MFITIYKKTKNNQLFLIRFELVNNKYRRWKGIEGRVPKLSGWKAFNDVFCQTGKARAAFYMFKQINVLIEKGFSVYKKKSKIIKTIKPIIRIRKLNLKRIEKFHDEGYKLYYNYYGGILAVRRADCCIYDNITHKKLLEQEKMYRETRLGYFINNKFHVFNWKIEASPIEIKLYLDYYKNLNLKVIIKINNNYYVNI